MFTYITCHKYEIYTYISPRLYICIHMSIIYHKGTICIYIYITCCHIQSWIISVASLQFQCFNPQISSARKQTPKPKQKIASTLASPKDSLFQHQRSGSTPKEKSKEKSLNLFESSWKNEWIPWILSFLHPKSFQVAGRCTHQFQTSPNFCERGWEMTCISYIPNNQQGMTTHRQRVFPTPCGVPLSPTETRPHTTFCTSSKVRIWVEAFQSIQVEADHQFHRVWHNLVGGFNPLEKNKSNWISWK